MNYLTLTYINVEYKIFLIYFATLYVQNREKEVMHWEEEMEI